MKRISTIFYCASLAGTILFFTGEGVAQGVPAPQQLTVERIEITGNSKTRAGVIRSYLNFAEGDAISPLLLERNWQRLAATQFFKSVEFYTRPGSEKGKLIVVIEVRERRWPYLQFEGGHSDLNGWYFVPLSVRFDNLFGRGNLMALRFYWGDRISKLSLRYLNPRLFEGAAHLSLELFGGQRQYLYYLDARQLTHDVEFGGLNLRFGGNRGLASYLLFGWRSYTYRPRSFARFSDIDSSLTAEMLPPAISRSLDEQRVSAISLGLHADLRDHDNYPLNGFWGAIIAERADREIGSDIDFDRLTFDARFYKRLFRGQVLALNFKAGATTEAAPFYERFYLGGANSLRGYPERRLTPLGYATRLLQGSVELRVPFTEPERGSRKSFPYAVAFFDFGGAWLPEQKLQSDSLYRAAGFGFRLNLPIVGLTRLDFAFPLDRVDDDDFQFHLSLGHSF